MKIYGITFLDFIEGYSGAFRYYKNKESAQKECDRLNRQDSNDEFGKYEVEEIEVIEE